MIDMDLSTAAARGATTICRAFEEHQQNQREITRRVRQRFETQDWAGIRKDTLEHIDLPDKSVEAIIAALRIQLGPRILQREMWAALKEAYTPEILGRDDFEIAQTFFNSLTRKVFTHAGVDPSIDYTVDEFPLPFSGWEMASARMYAVHRIDATILRRILEDAAFRAPFRDLAGDAAKAAERFERGLVEALGSREFEALDVLRPVFFRNKGAYILGRARHNGTVVPLVLALTHEKDGIEVDAVLHTQDELSIVFSFARWFFHVDVASPREVIGFLRTLLPKKRISELYVSLGCRKHGKTEFYRELVAQTAGSDERFVDAPGQQGLVMEVFHLPSYEFVFKVIKDAFPPQKNTTRERVMERYGTVRVHDRVGRLVGFQEFEHLTFPRERFSPELLGRLLEVAGRTVRAEGDKVTVRHCYVERRVVPLDLYLQETDEKAAEAAALDWGRCLKELAAANVFPGDVLLKNFGVTRHGRVLSYDYDELTQLTDCTFRRMPPSRDDFDELSAEPWYTVGEGDIFPEELRTFLGLQGRLREVFLEHHGDLFEVEFWTGLQERHHRGELVTFYPYAQERRLHPEEPGDMEAPVVGYEAASG
jgi:isocitrate dehydrogenase kinase/phosphatase